MGNRITKIHGSHSVLPVAEGDLIDALSVCKRFESFTLEHCSLDELIIRDSPKHTR